MIAFKCKNCSLGLKIDLSKISPNTKILYCKCPKCDTSNKVKLIVSPKPEPVIIEPQIIAPTPPQKEEDLTRITPPPPIEHTQYQAPDNGEVGWIVVHTEGVKTQTYALKKGKNIIGRASDSKPSDIPIETFDMYLSRNHCEIEAVWQNDEWCYILSDKKSLNGTYLNGKRSSRLQPSDAIYLNDGDTIQAGETKMVLKTLKVAKRKDIARNTVIATGYTKTIII